MKYTEQLFDGIFDKFLTKAKKTYLSGKISISEISHFAKYFALHFYNKKTEHLDFQNVENNYKLGENDTLIEVINRIDGLKKQKAEKLTEYKAGKNATKKQIEILENGINEINNCKLLFQSIYKYKIKEI